MKIVHQRCGKSRNHTLPATASPPGASVPFCSKFVVVVPAGWLKLCCAFEDDLAPCACVDVRLMNCRSLLGLKHTPAFIRSDHVCGAVRRTGATDGQRIRSRLHQQPVKGGTSVCVCVSAGSIKNRPRRVIGFASEEHTPSGPRTLWCAFVRGELLVSPRIGPSPPKELFLFFSWFGLAVLGVDLLMLFRSLHSGGEGITPTATRFSVCILRYTP